jgi:hypothetical protein
MHAYKKEDITRAIECPSQHFDALARLAETASWIQETKQWEAYFQALLTMKFNLGVTDPRTGMTLLMHHGQHRMKYKRECNKNFMRALARQVRKSSAAVDFCGRTLLHHVNVIFPGLAWRKCLGGRGRWGRSALVAFVTNVLRQNNLTDLRTILRRILYAQETEAKECACDLICEMYQSMHPSRRSFRMRWLYLAIQHNKLRDWAIYDEKKDNYDDYDADYFGIATLLAACEAAGMGDTEPFTRLTRYWTRNHARKTNVMDELRVRRSCTLSFLGIYFYTH